tara:strand:+ start:113 stop:313 length:201 start_codon:yes stop_codon:yes gene_type:complete
MAYKNDSNIAHCGPQHGVGHSKGKVGMYGEGVNMMGGCQISKHMSSNRYFRDMPIVSDQNPDKKGA